MSIEDIELENVERAERLLTNRYEILPNSLINSFNKIKEILRVQEVDEKLLRRISDVMYEVTVLDDLLAVDSKIKYLSDTFWHQRY